MLPEIRIRKSRNFAFQWRQTINSISQVKRHAITSCGQKEQCPSCPRSTMSHCDACNQEGVVSFSVQVHSFPTDAQLRKQWIRAVQHVIEGWTPREDSILCSKHFEESCYKEPDPVLGKKIGMMCRGLKDNAVPTIFKTTQKTAPVQESHRENGRLGSDELEARSKEKNTDANKHAIEELQPRSSRSTRSHDRSNGVVDINVVTLSDDGPPATYVKEVCHNEHRGDQEGIVVIQTDEKETNPGVSFDGEDLNLPLRKVFEQMAKIKEGRAKQVAVNQDRREGDDKWWSSTSQDFRTNLETHMQQLEMSRSKIPVTFDTAMSTTLSLLGDSQEIVRVKDELTVPCLGKLYSRKRTLCPRCGNVLDDMMKIVHHLCKAKKKFLDTQRFYDSIPDIVFVKDYQWQRLVKTRRPKSWKKAKTKEPEVTTSGLVDVFSLQEMHRPSNGPSSPNCGIVKTKIKKCHRNLWKRLKLKQTRRISRRRSPILKKDAVAGGFTTVKTHVRFKGNSKTFTDQSKETETLEGQFTTVQMHVRAKPNSKSVKDRSVKMHAKARRNYKTLTDQLQKKEMEEKREEERRNVNCTTFGDLTTEGAADLLFSDLSPGLLSVKHEPVDPEYSLQSDVGHLDGQSMAGSVHVPQVYPVGIIPSSLLLTSLNTAPCSVSNNSMDVDEKLFFPGSQMGSLLSDQAFQSPVQYGNPGAVRCSRCDTWCENEIELGWHQCSDSSSAPPVGGGGDGGGGGGGITGAGITLADGTVVKAEPMYDER